VHDDVIDGDDVRRGRLNVSGTFEAQALASGVDADRARHFGRTAGILAGDLALTAAVRAVATCGAPASTVSRLLDLFDEVLHATAAGELADVRLALDREPASLAEVLRMEEQKTSVYSFQLPLQAGAILAGADAPLVERLGVAGRMLGLAFQLVDDLLGLYGDPAETGKSTVSDLREGKQTSLVAHARGTEVADQVAAFLGRDLSLAEADQARALLEQSGSRSFIERLALDYATTAERTLEELGMPSAFLSSLSALTALVAATPRSAA
jgi:geranylgeranyl diphosphate synthase type II